MKKLMMLVALGLVGTSTLAQKANVRSAEKLATSNSAEARKLAAQAREHDETKNDAYTWFVSGQVEQQAFQRELVKLQLGQTADEPAMFEALMAEMPYLFRVYEIESQPDEKGKVRLKHTKKVKEVLKNDFRYLLNAGYHYIQNQDYKRSVAAFARFHEVLEHPLLAEEKGVRTPEVDTMAWDAAYLSVIASYEAKDYDQAIALGNKFKGQEYKRNEIYQVLSASSLAKQDTVTGLAVLEEGAKLFPKETYFLGNIVNVYANQGRLDDAIAFLRKGIEQDPRNALFITALGNLYERKEDFVSAEAQYKAAYDLDATSFDANYNLGRAYYNQGVTTRNVENLDKLTQDKAIELFRKSIPYLEAAYKLNAAEVYYTLASAYAQIGNEAKYDELMKLHSGGN